MTHTGHAGAQGHTDHTDEPHNHPNPPRHNPHVSATTEAAADSTAGRGQLQPFSRRAGEPPSGPLPAADSEEAAPCEPTLPPPAPVPRAPPRACSKVVGEMNGARSRRVARRPVCISYNQIMNQIFTAISHGNYHDTNPCPLSVHIV
jgi:hypothetical protein